MKTEMAQNHVQWHALGLVVLNFGVLLSVLNHWWIWSGFHSLTCKLDLHLTLLVSVNLSTTLNIQRDMLQNSILFYLSPSHSS